MLIKAFLLCIANSTSLKVQDQCLDTNFNADGTVILDKEEDPCSEYWGYLYWCGNHDTNDF